MAALINVSAKAFSAGNVTNLSTASFTIGGANRVLYVWTASGAGSPVGATAVKWGGSGGADLTQLGSTLTVGSFGRLSLWRLIAPTAQSSTVYVDWGTNQDETFIIAVSVEDADQTTPNNTVASGTGTNLTPSAAATSVSGDLVLDGFFYMDGGADQETFTEGAGQTVIETIREATTPYEGAGSSQETASGVSTTMSWTINSGSGIDTWGIFAFAVNEAAAGGGGTALLAQLQHHGAFL